jgi:hypothetical protein
MSRVDFGADQIPTDRDDVTPFGSRGCTDIITIIEYLQSQARSPLIPIRSNGSSGPY